MEIKNTYSSKEMTILPTQSAVVQAQPLATGQSQSTTDKVTLSSEAQALLAAEQTSTPTPPILTPMSGGAELPPPPPPPNEN